MSNQFEEHIKKALEQENPFTKEDTDEMWNQLESKLFENTQGNKKMKKRKRTIFVAIAAAAAAILIAFGSQTPTGSAMVDKVKAMFAPEKDVKTNIEGTKEDTKLNLHEGKKAKYVLYVDEERYQFITTEEADKVVLKEELPEQYPTVEMEIKQLEDKQPREAIAEANTQLSKQYDEIVRVEEVTYPLKATLITARDSNVDWNTPLAKVYIFSNGDKGSFVITQTLFMEAAEGHGARFDEMLKEFHMVE